MNDIIRTQNLCKHYKETIALDNVSLHIPRGAIYGLIGNNGAGKTTLMRILSNLQSPSSGTVVKSENIKIGAIIETPALYPTLALLTLGGKSVSSLNQSSTWTDPITHEIVENPLRIDSFARTANNIHVLVSPFAQAEFHSYLLFESEFGTKEETSLIFKDFPYHIEFCLFNILEILLFYKIGIRIFRKQDLK